MRITFIYVGPTKKSYVKDGVADFMRRIKRYADVEVIEVASTSAQPKSPVEPVLKKEGERILGRLDPRDHAVALAEDGRAFTSKGLAGLVEAFMAGTLSSGSREGRGGRNRPGSRGLTFIVGGAFGLHESVTKAADTVMSLSKMTLPHEVALLVLVEQVYRAFTIIKGSPYSH